MAWKFMACMLHAAKSIQSVGSMGVSPACTCLPVNGNGSQEPSHGTLETGQENAARLRHCPVKTGKLILGSLQEPFY